MPSGSDLLKKALPHVGEQYLLGALVPKNNARWTGPWDCAEFASWCVFQVTNRLYGCDNNHGNPVRADAFTGYWQRDATALGRMISVALAAQTPGAAVLRFPGFHPGAIDGIYGMQTVAAVSAFQLANGLVPDGELGQQTAAALGIQFPH